MDVRDELRGLLEQLGFDLDGLHDGVRLREDLEIDSTELTEIAVAIERRRSTRVDAARFQALKTFGELVEFVESVPARR